MLIGILSLQGDYQAHARSFSEIGTPTCEVKKPRDLQHLNGLVIPGGESTTLIKLMDSSGAQLDSTYFPYNDLIAYDSMGLPNLNDTLSIKIDTSEVTWPKK